MRGNEACSTMYTPIIVIKNDSFSAQNFANVNLYMHIFACVLVTLPKVCAQNCASDSYMDAIFEL